MNTYLTTCLLLLLSLSNLSHATDTPWQLKRDHAGVQIHQLSTASGYPMTRGTLTIEASLDDLLRLMHNHSLCQRWVFACKHAAFIKHNSPTQRLDYIVIDSPLWFADRDMYIASDLQWSGDTLSIRLSGQDNYDKGQTGKVRVRNIYGRWLFQPITAKQLKVTYQLHANPQLIPSSLLNQYVAESVFHTLINLRAMAQTND